MLLIFVFMTAAFGTLTIVMGYIAMQKLTRGRLKDYGMTVWYALVLFSVGGALHSSQEIWGIRSVAGVNLVYFEYFFYSAYYILLLFAIFSLYKMSQFMNFDRKSTEMIIAMEEREKQG